MSGSRTAARFVALPCGTDGNSLRGHTAHMIVFDEAAFIPEEVIQQVAMPMLATTDGTAIMLSTPYDRDHYFFRAFTSPAWSRVTSSRLRTVRSFLRSSSSSSGWKSVRRGLLRSILPNS